MKGESIVKGGKCTMEKIRPRPHTITEADSVPCKKLKTGDVEKGCTTKIAKARLVIALCELQVHSMQAFLKDLEVQSSQMVQFIGEQIRELERLKGILDEMDEL